MGEEGTKGGARDSRQQHNSPLCCAVAKWQRSHQNSTQQAGTLYVHFIPTVVHHHVARGKGGGWGEQEEKGLGRYGKAFRPAFHTRNPTAHLATSWLMCVKRDNAGVTRFQGLPVHKRHAASCSWVEPSSPYPSPDEPQTTNLTTHIPTNPRSRLIVEYRGMTITNMTHGSQV